MSDSDKCQPFFQVLKKAFQWDTKCEKAFLSLKTYLSSPTPILVSPTEGDLLIASLNLAHSLEIDQLEVCSDSQLVVRQIEDTYEAKSERMILYLKKVWDLLKKFVLVHVRHIPRVENSRVDTMAKLAIASQEDLSRSTLVEYLAEPSIDLYDGEVAPIGSEPTWMDPIWDYIIDGCLPDDPKEAAKTRMRSARFTNHKGSLYKRGFFTPILKCIAGKMC